MNKSQLELRLKALKAYGEELNAKVKQVETKSYRGCHKQLKQDLTDYFAEKETLEWNAKRLNVSTAASAMAQSGGDLGREPAITTKAMTGRELSPMTFSPADLQAAYKAYKSRQPMSIQTKAFSSVDNLLPAELDPSVVGQIHEWRILDKLEAVSISAPSYEYLVHNFAGDTGGPGVVAEGGTKPEYVPDATSQIATAIKIAVNTALSYETLMDSEAWFSYIQSQMFLLMADAENTALLNNSSGLVGFFQTSGILTHNCASDPSTFTAVDSVESAITQMRVGSALADPNLLILHPNAWAAIRRTKSSTGQYIVGDPLTQGVSAPAGPMNTVSASPGGSLWGVPVLTTTSMANVSTSSGLLLDTRKFGHALIREGIVMHQGFSGTDFVQNIQRYVFEERLSLAIVRPQAVLALSNLPVS
jgi:HK97 family phage major capsid protein